MARLGSSKRPAVATVKTMSRAEEIMALCSDHNWKVIVGVEPQEPEDISDIEKLLNETSASLITVRHEQKVGRNAPCPCGSGRKYKNCCGGR